MTPGDILDSMITIDLKIKARENKVEKQLEVLALQKQLNRLSMLLGSMISDMEEIPALRLNLSKFKVYRDEFPDVRVDTYEEAVSGLKGAVTALWDIQEFINLGHYETADESGLREYIKNLHYGNVKRNLWIDEVNRTLVERIEKEAL
jgi:hypothetical protein